MKRLPTALLCFFIALTARGQDAAQPASAPAPVTFVSYNLKNYLNMNRRVDGEYRENAPKPESEIKALVRIIVDTRPDILGVCEIGTEADVADLQKRLKASGLDLPHIEHVKAFDDARRLALFSRFPIVSTDSQTNLTYPIGDKRIAFKRGILDATVQIDPDYRLRCLGIHFKSKRSVEEADQALMRRNEASLLRKHAEAILAKNPKANLLFYGDFNETKNEQPIRVVRGKFGAPNFFNDIWLSDKDGSRWTYYWSYADQYSRFDFIFTSPGFYPEVLQENSYIHTTKDWFDASDHRPLVLKITPQEKETK